MLLFCVIAVVVSAIGRRMMLSVLGWRRTIIIFEIAKEVTRIWYTDLCHNLFDAQRSRFQKLARALYPESLEILT